MAYLGVDGRALDAATLGCGSGCSCGPCRSARFGETYLPDDDRDGGDQDDGKDEQDDGPDADRDGPSRGGRREGRGRSRGRPMRRSMRRGRRGGRLGGFGMEGGLSMAYHFGEAAPVRKQPQPPGPAPAPCRPDTVGRIVTRTLQILPTASQFGVRLSPHQISRIRCWLQQLRNAGTDDRFLTGQSMLDYKNSNGRNPITYSNVRQWLLPQYNVQKCIVMTDPQLLQRVESIDSQIIQGREWINRETATQGEATHRTVIEMMNWMNARERDTMSVYNCYCIDSGRC